MQVRKGVRKGMKIIIDGTPEEIAALVLSVQGRQREQEFRERWTRSLRKRGG